MINAVYRIAFIFVGIFLAQPAMSEVLYEQTGTGQAFNLPEDAGNGSYYYQVFPFWSGSGDLYPGSGGFTLEKDARFLRLKRLGGLPCNVQPGISLQADDASQILSSTFSGASVGDYCDFPLPPGSAGTRFWALLICFSGRCDDSEGSMVLDGSASNPGYLVATSQTLAQPGGWAFQLCDVGGCSDFSLPTVSIVPESLEFGALSVNESAQQALTIQSLSAEALTVRLASSLPFSVFSAPEFDLAAGESAQIELEFSPADIGDFNASLSVSAGSYMVEVPLTGQGLAPLEPVIALSEESLVFPDTIVGEISSPASVMVSNIGSGDLVVSGVSQSGDGGDFSVDASRCERAAVAPGESCGIDVSFTPIATGNREANVILLSNAANPDKAIALLGNGMSPHPSARIGPHEAIFADTYIGSTSEPVRFFVSNTGAVDVALGSLRLSGLSPNQFLVEEDACTATTLMQDESCSFSVAFRPTGTGSAIASAEIDSNTPEGELRAALSGVAITYESKACAGLKRIFNSRNCNLLANLRSPDYFGVPTADVADDVLLEYIKRNAKEVEYLTLQIDFGREVQSFLNGQASGFSGDQEFFENIKHVQDSVELLEALNLLLFSFGDISATTLESVSASLGALGTLVDGVKVFRRFELALQEKDLRNTLQIYIDDRSKSPQSTAATSWTELVQTYEPLLSKIANLNGGLSLDELSVFYENAYGAYVLVGLPGSQTTRLDLGRAMGADANGL